MENTQPQAKLSELILASQVKEGFNYRRRYNAEKMISLRASIKANGLMAPITVRALEGGGYQLIAGGRRYRAFVEEFGADAQIPANVSIMTDAEATAAMLTENKEREDPSIIEDAEGAARMLGLCNGDREEAARRLGWTRSLLDRRLAVMNAIQPVRDAYIDDKINVGHVEILAALRREVQEKVIQALLKSPTKITVEQLKAMAEQSLQNLEAAIFDRAECGSCQYNTGNQQALFEASFSGTRCTNKECFGTKTEGELEARSKALSETYQVVRIVRPGDNSTVLPLRVDGARGVGAEQALACRTCADFGACVSAVPDKLGNAYKDVCFNKSCNDDKVAINAAALKAEQDAQTAAAAPDKAGVEAGTTTKAGEGAKAPAAAAGGAKVKQNASAPVKPTASSEQRSVVKEYREKIWRDIFLRAATKLDVMKSRSLLVAELLHRPSDMDASGAREAISKALGLETLAGTSTHDLLTTILALDQQGLGTALQHLAANVSRNAAINDVVGYMTALDINIEKFWKVNETLLDVLTKTEIDAVCVELGLDKAMGKTYASLKNGSKKDFVAAVLTVNDFQYIGAVPALMRWKKK